MLIGEATGMISVFYEGIPSALISGHEAAKAIVESKKNVIEAYRDSMQDEIDYIIQSWKSQNLL